MDITNDYVIDLLEREADSAIRKSLRATPHEISVLHDVTLNDVHEALNHVHYGDAEVKPFAVKLMTSGTCTGKEMVRRQFSSDIGSIATSYTYSDEDSNWDRSVESGVRLRANLMQSWCIGNVVEEIGASFTTLELIGFITRSRSLDIWRAQAASTAHVRTDEHYWRGLAILAITEAVQPYSIPPVYSMEFMEWVPDQRDLTAIIQLIKERGVLSPETVRGVLNQTEAGTPLRIGIL